MSASTRRAIVGAALAAAALASFPGLPDPDRVFFQRDIGSYWYAQVATLRAVLAAGAWPVWDPYEGFGTPLLGDPQSQVLYPPQWLNLVLATVLAYKLFAFSHLLLAGVGAYRWMRRLGLPSAAALAGAFVWQSSGPLLSFVSVAQHFTGAAWMPWVLLMLERMIRRPGVAEIVALGATAALQSLGGSADLCVMTGLIALARVAWTGRAAAGHLARCAGAAMLAGGLAAAQWLPAAGVLAGSSRSQMTGLNTYWSLHPAHLVDVLAARLLTEAPIVPSVRAVLFEGREPFVETLYLGPMAVGLALAGALAGGRARGVAAGAVFFALLSLGRFGPLAFLFAVPLFSFLRYPMKYTVPAALLCGLLAGFGVERWRDPSAPPRPFAVAGSLLLLLTVLGVAACAWIGGHPAAVLPYLEGPVPPGATAEGALLWPALRHASLACAAAMVAALLLLSRARGDAAGRWLAAAALVLVVLGLAGARTANALGPSAILDAPAALAHVRGDRVLSVRAPGARLNREMKSRPGWSREASFARGAQECLAPVTPARWGRRGSYDGDPTLLAAPVVGEATALVGRYLDTAFGLRLLHLGAVSDVVVCDDERRLSLPVSGTAATVFPFEVRVVPVPGALPRVRLAPGVREVASVDEAWHALGSVSFDPATDVVLQTGRTVDAAPPTPDASHRLAVRVDRADRLEVDVESAAPVALVVADAWAGGWKAEIDGRVAPVHRANQLFRGVVVPAGAHHVVLSYRPAELQAGLGVSGVTALVAMGFLARARRRHALPPALPPQ